MYQIHRQDIIEWAKEYDGPKFHCSLLDPPYHLSTPQRFGKPGSAPAKGDVYRRASAGFMNQVWDGGGIAFDPETWAALARHHYPGAFIMAFGGSRGYHRMATAAEDAGLIIHPAMGWVFLSGFPKATRIKGYGSPSFKGHRYGLQAQKPAFEFIAVAQVPYVGRPVDSIVATGAGALNIDGGRIGRAADDRYEYGVDGDETATNQIYGKFNPYPYEPHNAGRWPANFLLSHHPEDNGECHPDCPVRLFDEQSGILHSGARKGGAITTGSPSHSSSIEGGYGYKVTQDCEADSGPASRMFHRSDWSYEVAEQLANAEPVKYEPKVSTAEREAGLDDLETVTRHRMRPDADPDKLTGLNTESRFAPVQVKNNHPTLKPISLAKYLATLLLPPAAYAPRRILVPFAGVGSEMAGAILAGWEEVIGIERESGYVKIAEARLRWWSQWPGWGQTDVDAILAAAGKDEAGQMSLFGEAA